jgi:hypothetical protein
MTDTNPLEAAPPAKVDTTLIFSIDISGSVEAELKAKLGPDPPHRQLLPSRLLRVVERRQTRSQLWLHSPLLATRRHRRHARL